MNDESRKLEREALQWLGYCAVGVLAGLGIGGLGILMQHSPSAARIILLGIVGIFVTAAILFHETDRD